MRSNPMKAKLAAGGTVYGTMIFEFLSPGLPRIVANSGAEFILYDLEHSGFTIQDMKTQFALCAGAGLVPLARPPGKAYHITARMLDVGSFGLMYQMVGSATEARELVRRLGATNVRSIEKTTDMASLYRAARMVAVPSYRFLHDPDGRSWRMRRRKTF